MKSTKASGSLLWTRFEISNFIRAEILSSAEIQSAWRIIYLLGCEDGKSGRSSRTSRRSDLSPYLFALLSFPEDWDSILLRNIELFAVTSHKRPTHSPFRETQNEQVRVSQRHRPRTSVRILFNRLKSCVSSDLTPYSSVKVSRRFGGTYRFNLQGLSKPSKKSA
jgi:hypothetical protein